MHSEAANFDVIRHTVSYAKEVMPERKIDLVIVSNLSLMVEDIAGFISENKISVPTSLDGPKSLHDKNRPINNTSSYDAMLRGERYYQGTASQPEQSRYPAVNYMELRSPCGASIGQIAFTASGDVYTCDEGRMISEMFSLTVIQTGWTALHAGPLCQLPCLRLCLRAMTAFTGLTAESVR